MAMLFLAGHAGAQAVDAMSRPGGPILQAIREVRLPGAVDRGRAPQVGRAGLDARSESPIQTAAPSKKRTHVIWGAVIGGVAGIAGGALAPTHSNGEYLVGGGRGQSALAVGAVGAGLGALVGAIIGARR